MPKQGNVFIVGAEDAVTDSLQALLDTVGYATQGFASGQAFLDCWKAGQAGCALLDIRMTKSAGARVQDLLRRTGSRLPVVMMLEAGDVAAALEAMRGGAVDFLEKPVEPDWLFESVDRALSIANGGEFDAALHGAARRKFGRLTWRERAITERLAKGQGILEIAGALRCDATTVEICRGRIMKRTGARSLTQLMRLAFVACIGG